MDEVNLVGGVSWFLDCDWVWKLLFIILLFRLYVNFLVNIIKLILIMIVINVVIKSLRLCKSLRFVFGDEIYKGLDIIFLILIGLLLWYVIYILFFRKKIWFWLRIMVDFIVLVLIVLNLILVIVWWWIKLFGLVFFLVNLCVIE